MGDQQSKTISYLREYGCKAPSLRNLGEMLSVRALCTKETEREYWESSFAQKYLLVPMESFAAFKACYEWHKRFPDQTYEFGMDFPETTEREILRDGTQVQASLRATFLNVLRLGATFDSDLLLTLPPILPTSMDEEYSGLDCALSWDEFWKQRFYPVHCLGLVHDYEGDGEIFYGMERLGVFPGKNND